MSVHEANSRRSPVQPLDPLALIVLQGSFHLHREQQCVKYVPQGNIYQRQEVTHPQIAHLAPRAPIPLGLPLCAQCVLLALSRLVQERRHRRIVFARQAMQK